MTDFARLVLDADTRGLKNAERDLKNVDAQAARTARDVDGASNKMVGAFKRVGVALVAAGIGTVLFDFGKKSVQAAIDAEEMDSAFGVVFGNMADDVREWARITGDTLGRSTQEIQRGALAFQELFGKALDPAQAAEMSKQFAVLTQDLASFKNLSNEVAQQKLFSGLVGEAEPLRAVGVFLNETAVQAKAAELGLSGVNGVLTDQEKIVARAAIINEQLSDAQGDVARTSGSTANQIKTMEAAVEELQVAIGQKLLPVLTPLITLTADLITKLANAASAFQVSGESVKNYIRGLEILGGWIGRAASAFQSLGNWLGWANERMAAAGRTALRMAGPINQVVSFIERLGGRANNNDRVGLGGALPSLSGIIPAGFNTEAPQVVSNLAAVSSGVEGVGRAVGAARGQARAANDDFADLMENLFPESITRRQQQQLALIDKYEARIFDVAKARRRALGIDDDADVSSELTNEGPLAGAQAVSKAAEGILSDMAKASSGTKKEATTITDTFAQMAQRITGSLQGLANSIQSGNFLGILGGVLDIFTQLGSAGVFGSGLQTRLNKPVAGARANGGSVAAGSTYLVGERGPELFTAPGAGRIHSNDNLRGGSSHVTVGIDPRNGNITAFVNGQIAATAPSVANAGAMQAQAMRARSARRTVRR